jgi:hypothetical protein
MFLFYSWTYFVHMFHHTFNAINIAERLDLPLDFIESSWHLLGTVGAEARSILILSSDVKVCIPELLLASKCSPTQNAFVACICTSRHWLRWFFAYRKDLDESPYICRVVDCSHIYLIFSIFLFNELQMEGLTVDMNKVSCYYMIEQYCADTMKQLNDLQKQSYALCLLLPRQVK